ncbi:MAG: BON domain-containing protein [Vicinamibacterales bacterium]
MTADQALQRQVLAALDWEPGVDAAQIGVTVANAVVTLEGTVTTFFQKSLAEHAARHVVGVRAVANDLEVSPDHATRRSDTALAQAVANTLLWDSAVPLDAVQATVDDGWVTLTGTVASHFQRGAAERAIRHLYGLKGVSNAIRIRPEINIGDIKAKIESAFMRSAHIDAEHVQVEAHDGKVVLTGTVRSLAERDEAARAAWAAPGVIHVDDRLIVAITGDQRRRSATPL